MKMQTLTVASVATVTAMAAGLATADSITIDLAGINSNDNFGSEINEQIVLTELAGATITGIGWDNVVGNGDDTGATWGNEMNMVFDAAINVQFFPSEGGATAGGIWGPASSGGILATSLDVGAGGLVIEFYESYDDVTGATDAHYDSGTVTIEYAVPAPGALALLGLAGIAGRRRRRG